MRFAEEVDQGAHLRARLRAVNCFGRPQLVPARRRQRQFEKFRGRTVTWVHPWKLMLRDTVIARAARVLLNSAGGIHSGENQRVRQGPLAGESKRLRPGESKRLLGC